MNKGESDELIKTLRDRFEKNMYRHKGLYWEKVEEKLLASPQKLETLNEMENTKGEPDVIVMTKMPKNLFSLIVQSKVQQDAAAFVTTVKRLIHAKKINLAAMRLKWQRLLELNYSRNKNIANCKSLVNLIRKHQAG
jgi:hypothetical protein